MTPVIRQITDPTDLDTISRWMYDWWGQMEGYSPESVRTYLAHSLCKDRLPRTYGLYLGERRMYQFTMSDLFVRPDLYPWLANVYIEPDFRHAGYGRFLLGSIAENADGLDADALYLFTAHKGLYEKYGWEFVEEIDTHLTPRLQRLYRLPLGRTPSAP